MKAGDMGSAVILERAAEVANKEIDSKGLSAKAEGRTSAQYYLRKKDGKPRTELILTFDKAAVYKGGKWKMLEWEKEEGNNGNGKEEVVEGELVDLPF